MSRDIKHVFLDLGRVLFHLDYQEFFCHLMKYTSLPEDQVKKTMTWNGLNIEFETGSITESQYFDQMKEQIGFTGY